MKIRRNPKSFAVCSVNHEMPKPRRKRDAGEYAVRASERGFMKFMRKRFYGQNPHNRMYTFNDMSAAWFYGGCWDFDYLKRILGRRGHWPKAKN